MVSLNTEEKVVLVDPQGRVIPVDGGIATMPKMEAHLKGVKHLAVSVFIFNSHGQLLLQQRALSKYHSPGRWSNSCCTHPRVQEEPLAAAQRRLSEELRMRVDLNEVFTFSYFSDVGQGLTENEFDHVFIGRSEKTPDPDPEEVGDWQWVDPSELDLDIQRNQSKYTTWFLPGT